MKKGAKAAVFIASMALTVGSLIAVVGPRHHKYCGMHAQQTCAQTDSTVKPQ
jgi:hypothetical protein